MHYLKNKKCTMTNHLKEDWFKVHVYHGPFHHLPSFQRLPNGYISFLYGSARSDIYPLIVWSKIIMNIRELCIHHTPQHKHLHIEQDFFSNYTGQSSTIKSGPGLHKLYTWSCLFNVRNCKFTYSLYIVMDLCFFSIYAIVILCLALEK